MLIDTHCHLDAREFDKDRSDLVAAANRAGVAEIVVPGVSAADFARLRDCCRAYAGCHPAYGLHPLYVREAAPEDLDVLRDWLVSEHPVAVGEIGLDCYLPDLDLPRQEFFFVQQLKLAREFSLPVILHVRRAVDHVPEQHRPHHTDHSEQDGEREAGPEKPAIRSHESHHPREKPAIESFTLRSGLPLAHGFCGMKG